MITIAVYLAVSTRRLIFRSVRLTNALVLLRMDIVEVVIEKSGSLVELYLRKTILEDDNR